MTPKLSHAEWRSILLPVAKAAVERGEFADILGGHQKVAIRREHYAVLIANYAAVDMVLSGRTHMLSMDEVRALPVFAGRSAAPSGLSRFASQAKPAAANARKIA